MVLSRANTFRRLAYRVLCPFCPKKLKKSKSSTHNLSMCSVMTIPTSCVPPMACVLRLTGLIKTMHKSMLSVANASLHVVCSLQVLSIPFDMFERFRRLFSDPDSIDDRFIVQ